MNRKVLIISNPGENGDENYCDGVLRDVDNYRGFLTSACGGLWSYLDISHMPRPTISEARQAIRKLEACDYALIIFTGHGWYSTDLDSTILTLKAGQEIDSVELQNGAPKQTIVLDCCRKKYPGLPLDESVLINASAALLKRASSRLNHEQCKHYYNEKIKKCDPGTTILYSCASGEKSQDNSQRGGLYSYNIIEFAERWADNTEFDLSNSYYTLSVVRAHEGAKESVQRKRKDQNPQIEKPRSAPYFPFCIAA
jgi:hypothetical protein